MILSNFQKIAIQFPLSFFIFHFHPLASQTILKTHTHTHKNTPTLLPHCRVQTPISHIQGIPIIASLIPRDNPTQRKPNISKSKLILINR